MDIKELLLKQARDYPNKSAVFFEGKSIDFSELKDNSFKLANFLISKGLTKSDKVALYLSNTPQAIISFLGIFSSGLSVVPMDFMLTQSEIITFLNHSQARVLITQAKKSVDIGRIKKDCPNLEHIITVDYKSDDCFLWEEIMSSASSLKPQTQNQNSDLAAIFYTSGSTGHPKGVMLNYSQLDNPAYAIDYFLGISNNDIFLCGGVPFSHVGGLDYILLTVTFASSLVLMERFHPFEFLKNVQNYKVTVFCIVPAMFFALLSLKEYEKFDLSSLRYAVVFGAPSSPAVLRLFHRAYPNAKLANGWGMTETAAPNTISPPGDEKIRSIGKFTPNVEVKIVDEFGNKLDLHQKGELLIKGQPIMPGYYREKDLTKEVFIDGVWLKTGDIAYFDEEGLYYIVGRKKDMIKVAGEIVFPAEVEEKLLTNPKVKEAAVIGVPDKMRGEVPKAFITLNQGQNIDQQELVDFLKEHIAHFKIPHYFELLEELPKNRTGKIDKTKLTKGLGNRV
ncbi:MAG: AMP-binding protein [Candidatus Omnitrophica bacterium]|nr:AMP-binding protein [Candidatus Omnitrophota bacterium]